jgi:hypothetical protein
MMQIIKVTLNVIWNKELLEQFKKCVHSVQCIGLFKTWIRHFIASVKKRSNIMWIYCLATVNYMDKHCFHVKILTQKPLLPIQWVLGDLSPGVKQQGGEADHSPPTSAEVKKMWSYTSTPPYASWHSA